MGKICIYARVSTIDKQDYDRQISDCMTSIGDKYHKDDIEIFAEKISGYSDNEDRPELNRLLNIIESDSKYFKGIYVTEISRLGRNPSTTRQLLDYLSDKNIFVYVTSMNTSTIDSNGERSGMMNTVLQFLIEIGNSESRTLKKRSMSGLLESAKKGNAGAGKYLAYGYKKDENKKLIINEVEAEVIKEIFDQYQKGYGFKKIAGYLNDNKIPTRTNISFGKQVMNFNTVKSADKVIWSDKTVNDIVVNSIYKGDRRFKGHILPAPAIISAELFDECNSIMKTKTHRNYVTTYNYLLKDLCTCGICGRNYFAKYKPQTTKGDRVYVCSSRLMRGGNCGNKGININYIESVIYEVLLGQDTLLKFIKDSNDIKNNVGVEIEKLKHQLKLENGSQKKINIKISKLLDLYEESNMSVSEYKEKLELRKKEAGVINDRISIINKSITDKKNMLVKIKELEKDKDYLKKITSNRNEIITIFKQFIKNIYITKMNVNGDVLLDVHISMSNNKPGSSLKIMIDSDATRFKAKTKYTYRLVGKDLITNYDDKGILTTSEAEIYKTFGEVLGKFEMFVKEHNIMTMPVATVEDSEQTAS